MTKVVHGATGVKRSHPWETAGYFTTIDRAVKVARAERQHIVALSHSETYDLYFAEMHPHSLLSGCDDDCPICDNERRLNERIASRKVADKGGKA